MSTIDLFHQRHVSVDIEKSPTYSNANKPKQEADVKSI